MFQDGSLNEILHFRRLDVLPSDFQHRIKAI